MPIPISRRCYREFDPDYGGHCVMSDIDRTYLQTRFSTLRGMTSIVFERAIDKQDIPGMARLLRELRRGNGTQTAETPLFFLSASPAQLRPIIERKLLHDGIGFDGTIFKDWVRVLSSARPRHLRDQIAFKLTALLRNRLALPRGAREILLGDDLESDPHAYALYADLVAGRLEGDEAAAALVRFGVGPSEAPWIVDAAARARGHAPPVCALIRLERRTPEDFAGFGGHVIPCQGAFQMALLAHEHAAISVHGVVRVAGAEFRARHGVLEARLHDALRRGLLQGASSRRVVDALRRAQLLGGDLPEAAPVPDRPERWTPP